MKCPECQTENLSDSKFCKECATPLTSFFAEKIELTKTLDTSGDLFSPGSVFAHKYQIIEELGQGGMGRVYRVYDREVEEYVALKIIKPDIANDKNTIRRFRNELKIARKISHKNVCRMFDLNREDETTFITMEYVPGEDLKTSLRRMGPLSLGKAIFIARQVCEGLAEAHRLGVIHRDLKPQNIMIDREGNARIMDFGVARSLESKGVTDSGSVIGTPEYMSPEQVEGKEVDSRSDIYSLGAILYELVTGQVPFAGNTPMSVALKHVTAAPVEPRGLNSHIPEEINRVILKCMAKAKEARFQGAKKLSEELQRIAMTLPATDPVLPAPKTPASREITVTLRPKLIVIPLVVICGVAILGLLGWRFVFNPGTQVGPESLSAEIRPESETSQPALEEKRSATETEAPLQQQKISPAEKNSTPPRETNKRANEAKESSPGIKQEPDIEPDMQRGNQAFSAGRYPEAIQYMEAVLDKDPNNISARSLLEESKTQIKLRRIQREVVQSLAEAQAAFDQDAYQVCLEKTHRVLELEPDHPEALALAQAATEKLAVAQIQVYIDRFVSAWNTKTLPDFYRETCSPELYKKYRKDAELVMSVYDGFQAVASNTTFKFEGLEHVSVSFAGLTTGVRARDGKREVIFEGSYVWEMIHRGSSWQIVKIETRDIKMPGSTKEEI
jgi:serine/threonine protein kinase